MGVTGLWRLIEPAGKPVPVETLENNVLAVDISIWLHQMVKGYQDAKGAPVANAHLIGLFQRVCKLLYFRIKPVFVFDGAFPELKKETIAKRQDTKVKYNSESERIKRELVLLLSKKTAIGSLLGKQISPSKVSPGKSNSNVEDIFKLPALPPKEADSESESDDDSTSSGSVIDLHSVDIESNNFKSLPVKEKYDLLVELKETRKQNSWGRLHELPKKSNNFADFQMQRLLKRRKVQECLQETEKEMGDQGMSFNELESLLNDVGIDTKFESLPTKRIAYNNSTRYLLINDVKKALAEAKKKKEEESKPQNSKEEEKKTDEVSNENEDELQKAIQMSLECCENEPTTDILQTNILKKDELEEDTKVAIKMSLNDSHVTNNSECNSKTDDSWTSFLTESSEDENSDEDDGYEDPQMTSAKAYIMQYSDFTYKAIDKIVHAKDDTVKSNKKLDVNQIIHELEQEKSIIDDNINISSEDEPKDKSIMTNKQCLPEQITQEASVIYVENESEIIDLDISNDETKIKSIELDDTYSKNETILSSSSSDDDFEEVLECNNLPTKPALQLMINMDEAPDDDIFADVFQSTSNKFSIQNEKEQEKLIPVNSFQGNEETSMIDRKEKLDNNNILLTDTTRETIIKKDTNKSENETKSKSYEGEKESIQSKLLEDKNKNRTNEKVNESFESKSHEDNHQKCTNVIVNVDATPKQPLDIDKLNSIADDIQHEEQGLLEEISRLDRMGRNITEQMTKEAQELLQIFGIPYIVAPMEAEAQCAFLESVNLTNGTITDDSDIWLFGGKTVYKNFFNQKKHVLQFLSDRIERSYNLTREQLILLALLVGSDYTTGVSGVGPVTAMEILASFPLNKKQNLGEATKLDNYKYIVNGLQEFKKWVRSGKRTDNTSLKKKLRNVTLTEDFPSVRVVQAYMEPNIEKSKDKFTWGELDVTVLRKYTKAKFGWSQNKLDEIIQPVVKRIVEGKSQKSIQDYFKKKVEFQSLQDHMSKRVKAAVSKMTTGNEDCDVINEEDKTKRKRKMNTTKSNKKESVPTKAKQRKKKTEEDVIGTNTVKVLSVVNNEGRSDIDIVIPKLDRSQDFIPQREKDKKSLLQNKLKAIEIFRKTKIDTKKKAHVRLPNLPKDKAELSESDSD